jgi:hypothetical protein
MFYNTLFSLFLAEDKDGIFWLVQEPKTEDWLKFEYLSDYVNSNYLKMKEVYFCFLFLMPPIIIPKPLAERKQEHSVSI